MVDSFLPSMIHDQPSSAPGLLTLSRTNPSARLLVLARASALVGLVPTIGSNNGGTGSSLVSVGEGSALALPAADLACFFA
jgi:hypothetical protein